jgi:hypothetical protein
MTAWPPAAATFQAAKGTLAAALPLAHPAPNAVLSLATDASVTHVGGILQQLFKGSWQPLAFISKKLVLHLRQGAARHLQRCLPLLAPGRGAPFLPPDRPQAPGQSLIQHYATLAYPPAAAAVIHHSSDIRHTSGQENLVAVVLCRPPVPYSPTNHSQHTAASPPASFNAVVED